MVGVYRLIPARFGLMRDRKQVLNEIIFIGSTMNTAFRGQMAALGGFANTFTFPDDYFIFDLETTGFGFDQDYIIQVGWAIVRDRQIVDNDALVLNWTRHPGMNVQWLQDRLAYQAEEFAKQGKVHQLGFERIAASDVEPLDGLLVMQNLLRSTLQDNEWCMGHGAWRFDRRMIDSHQQRFFGNCNPVPWQPNSIFDTGLFVKAAQLNRLPTPTETMDDWFRKVSGIRSPVKWAMDKFCIPTFGLADRCNIDPTKCHDAGYDAMVTHYLFETFREIGESYHR